MNIIYLNCERGQAARYFWLKIWTNWSEKKRVDFHQLLTYLEYTGTNADENHYYEQANNNAVHNVLEVDTVHIVLALFSHTNNSFKSLEGLSSFPFLDYIIAHKYLFVNTFFWTVIIFFKYV